MNEDTQYLHTLKQYSGCNKTRIDLWSHYGEFSNKRWDTFKVPEKKVLQSYMGNQKEI